PDVDPRLIVRQVPGNVSAETAHRLDPNYNPEDFQVAVVSLLIIDPDPSNFSGTLSRDELEPTEEERPQEPTKAPQSQQPGFFRHIGASVRFEKDPVPIGYELRLTVDFKTAHEEGLEKFREDIDTIGPGL